MSTQLHAVDLESSATALLEMIHADPELSPVDDSWRWRVDVYPPAGAKAFTEEATRAGLRLSCERAAGGGMYRASFFIAAVTLALLAFPRETMLETARALFNELNAGLRAARSGGVGQ